jgi:DNA-binding PadR family transcriptional regulator
MTDQMARIEGFPSAEINPSGFTLHLPPTANDLVYNEFALSLGLIAIGLIVDSSGSVLRKRAISFLLERMALNQFVRQQSYYINAERTAATILDGLCKRGMLGRWNAPMRQFNRSGPTTKGYYLTPLGRTELEKLMLELPPEYQRPLRQTVDNIESAYTAGEQADAEDQPMAPEPLPFSDEELLRRLEARQDRIKPLTDSYDTKIAESAACDQMMDDLRSKFEQDMLTCEAMKAEAIKVAMEYQKNIRFILMEAQDDRPAV